MKREPIQLIDQPMVHEEIMKLPGVSFDRRFDKDTISYVYEDKVFALIDDGSKPVKITLMCEPYLAKTLRDKYETIMPAEKMNAARWNSVLLTGQLSWQDTKDLIHHSYNLLTKKIVIDLGK